jgi:uncharacterized protein (DUF885 family)
VERYVAYPGQALSYKIGELEILELRHRAEAALGARFDIKAFHDQILLGGSMPLTTLDQKVDRWLASGTSGDSTPATAARPRRPAFLTPRTDTP